MTKSVPNFVKKIFIIDTQVRFPRGKQFEKGIVIIIG